MKIVPKTALLLLFATGFTGPRAATCTDDVLPPETLGNDKAPIEALLQLGIDCAQAGKLERAVTLFTEVIKREPTNSVAYLNRGSTQVRLGELGLAVDDFTTAIGLQPNLAEAWYDRGTTLAHVALNGRSLISLKRFD